MSTRLTRPRINALAGVVVVLSSLLAAPTSAQAGSWGPCNQDQLCTAFNYGIDYCDSQPQGMPPYLCAQTLSCQYNPTTHEIVFDGDCYSTDSPSGCGYYVGENC